MVPSTGYLNIFELRKYRRGVLLRFPQLSSPGEIPEYSDEKMLYQTFGEQTHWGKLMGINYVSDLNRKIEDGKIKDLIQLSEALHERKIIEIADMIIKKNRKIVLIAGPSSSGKTTFAQRLCIQLRVNGLDPGSMHEPCRYALFSGTVCIILSENTFVKYMFRMQNICI